MFTRRQFLATLLAGCFIPKTVGYREDYAATALTDKLAALFTQTESIAALGKRYKTATDLSTEINTLLSYLNLSQGQLVTMHDDALKQHLKTTIAQDFQHAQVETLNGWVLSRTELQLWHVLSAVSV
jgi:hypothetical protein